MDFDELYKSIILTEESVLEAVDEYTLYCFYTGYDNIPLHKAIRCPFRQDNVPSFSVFETTFTNRVTYFWKDSATGESGDVFKLIQKVEKLSNRQEVLTRINEDFALGYDRGVIRPREKIVFFPRPVIPDIKITIAPTLFTGAGLEFWQQYSIGEDLLSLYNVQQIKWYWSYPEQKTPTWVPDPTFSYRIGGYYQIYSPYAPKVNKFRNDLPENYFFGYLQLSPSGEKLIIDKSSKDVIFCRRLGYEAVAPRSESTMIPHAKMLEFKERFKEVYITLDPDNCGYTMTEKYMEKYPWLKPRFLSEAKDKTDLRKKVGFDKAKEIIDNMLR